MATGQTITSALKIHATLASLTMLSQDEETTDFLVNAEASALDAALELPALDFGDVRMKIAAIIADSDGCGLIEVDRLALVSRDLDLLLGTVQ